ncbi:MAG: site-2 protease family protein [Candidatus Omnitrophota bacterium]|nr:MAG: site-2 protease family protein [Candidatus Omnitrophota bacterium]
MTLLFLLILYVSITLHEYSHGWTASKLGDPTPKESGRLTLNPLAHIDPFGTIIMPLLLIILSRGTFAFGYAKPVPINPYHFRNPKKDIMWVGLSGPLTNLCIALFLSLLAKMPFLSFIAAALIWGVVINLVLAIFNLIPIPPLDGSRIVASLLPYRLAYLYLRMEMAGFFIVILLIMLGFFEWFLFPLVKIMLTILGIGEVI